MKRMLLMFAAMCLLTACGGDDEEEVLQQTAIEDTQLKNALSALDGVWFYEETVINDIKKNWRITFSVYSSQQTILSAHNNTGGAFDGTMNYVFTYNNSEDERSDYYFYLRPTSDTSGKLYAYGKTSDGTYSITDTKQMTYRLSGSTLYLLLPYANEERPFTKQQ